MDLARSLRDEGGRCAATLICCSDAGIGFEDVAGGGTRGGAGRKSSSLAIVEGHGVSGFSEATGASETSGAIGVTSMSEGVIAMGGAIGVAS